MVELSSELVQERLHLEQQQLEDMQATYLTKMEHMFTVQHSDAAWQLPGGSAV